MIKFDRYKNGMHFAVRFSYDDGNVADRRLVDIFNKYGIKATFSLISGRFDHDTVVSSSEIKSLYEGHEIAVHTLTHPHLERLPITVQTSEILEDRKNLESVCGKLVRGMAYPYGTYNADTLTAMKSCGIVYSRTTGHSRGLSLPEDFMLWHPTCHHTEAEPIIKNFLENTRNQSWNYGGLLYIWGHSYEFDRMNNWELAEKICASIAGLDDVWYATNMEIYDYVTAMKNLVVSCDGKSVFNPSATSVWVSSDGEPVEIRSGKTVCVG